LLDRQNLAQSQSSVSLKVYRAAVFFWFLCFYCCSAFPQTSFEALKLRRQKLEILYEKLTQDIPNLCREYADYATRNKGELQFRVIDCLKHAPSFEKRARFFQGFYERFEELAAQNDLLPSPKFFDFKELNLSKNDEADVNADQPIHGYSLAPLNMQLYGWMLEMMPSIPMQDLKSVKSRTLLDWRAYFLQLSVGGGKKDWLNLKLKNHFLSILKSSDAIAASIHSLYPEADIQNELLRVEIRNPWKVPKGINKSFVAVTVTGGTQKFKLGFLVGKFDFDEMKESIVMGETNTGPKRGVYFPYVLKDYGVLVVEPIRGRSLSSYLEAQEWMDFIRLRWDMIWLMKKLPFPVFDVKENYDNVMRDLEDGRALIVDHSKTFTFKSKDRLTINSFGLEMLGRLKTAEALPGAVAPIPWNYAAEYAFNSIEKNLPGQGCLDINESFQFWYAKDTLSSPPRAWLQALNETHKRHNC